MSDIYDDIAQSLEDDCGFDGPSAVQIAHAFRAHFAQRTCASCRYWTEKDSVAWMCDRGVNIDSEDQDSRTFSCSLWEPKP